MKKQLLSLFMLLLPVLWAAGQGSRQYTFTHYSVLRGLASHEAVDALQDSQGFMWIATANGLQRFDGLRYLTFRHRKSDPHSLPHNSIVQLLLDKKNNLWLMTGDGSVGIFDTRRFRFQRMAVKVRNERSLLGEKQLIQDEEGNLFLLFHHSEFLTYHEEKKEFAAEHNFIPTTPSWKIVDVIHQPGTRKYWIGSDKGIAVFNRQTNQLSFSGRNIDREGLIDEWGHLAYPVFYLFDKRGRLWFESWQGGSRLFAYDMKNRETVIGNHNLSYMAPGYHETKGMMEQKDSTLWIKGLNVFGRFLEKEKRFQPVYNGYLGEQSIDYDRVTCLFEDRDRNIWVTTNNNGLYSFNPSEQFFSNIRQINRVTNQPGRGSIMSFMLTRQNRTLLAGAWGDGLYRYDSNYRMVPLNIRGIDEKSPVSIWSMCASPDSSSIWMGAQPGIYRFEQSTGSATYYNPPALQNRTVRQVACDRFGNLWMGTFGLGLFKWTTGESGMDMETGVRQFVPVPVTQILKLFVCRNGYVWAGTSSHGLYVIDPSTDKIVYHFDRGMEEGRKLGEDAVPAIMQYDDTTVVIASNALHFFHSRLGKITRTIQLPESGPGSIASMEKDKNGYIWLSLSSGIYRVNPRNEIFVLFDRVDGIVNDHFVTGASYRLPSGRITFGAENQFVIFDPLKVVLNDPAPEVVITGFKAMNQSLLVDSLLNRDRIELNPQGNSMTVEFSGLGYGRTFIIKYMLEGLDKDWIVADNTMQAVYSHLPARTYQFLVRSEDAEGNASQKTTRLVIKVKPHFWKTWWFLGLVAFAAVGLFYWLDRLRMQKIRATESIRTRIATSLTEDMSNTLSSINVSSELARNKVDTDRARTREYINQISDASNRMMESMQDMVWSINPGHDNMLATIARMKEFAVDIENAHEVVLIFDIDNDVMRLKLDMEYRYELLSIFKESITNAVKHGNPRHIQVSMRYKKPSLIMMIEDDGRGFEDLQCGLLGRGISDMRRRAAALDASFHIESNENTGSIVKLEMKIR